MRSIIQFGMAAICIGLVGSGLFMSLGTGGKDIVLATEGTPGRLIADSSTATAFFELKGEDMELTMLFSDEDEPENVFRTRVTLANGQSHSIVVSESDDGSDSQRFVFHRSGNTLTMSLSEPEALTASFKPAD